MTNNFLYMIKIKRYVVNMRGDDVIDKTVLCLICHHSSNLSILQ